MHACRACSAAVWLACECRTPARGGVLHRAAQPKSNPQVPSPAGSGRSTGGQIQLETANPHIVSYFSPPTAAATPPPSPLAPVRRPRLRPRDVRVTAPITHHGSRSHPPPPRPGLRREHVPDARARDGEGGEGEGGGRQAASGHSNQRWDLRGMDAQSTRIFLARFCTAAARHLPPNPCLAPPLCTHPTARPAALAG